MKYGSVCSGIEAASCAWHPLGWAPQWFAEIEPFPSAVLAHRWPSVPNLGDFTKIGAEHGPIDLLVGGTPCQSFSVAGLRGGMADERGNLALEFLRLAARVRARWLVWENVPGVLSSNGGRDFGSILGGMVELGYGIAYRVLDAQHFGVPQRRRRVFVVGYFGDWRPAAAVLFERASLSGDPPPRRASREDVARPLAAGSARGSGYRNDADTAENLIPDVSPALKARDYKGPSSDGDGDGAPLIAHALRAQAQSAHDSTLETYVAHSLRGEGFDASEDGTGRGTPLVPVMQTIPLLEVNGRSGSRASNKDGLGIGDPALTFKVGKIDGVFTFDTTQITSPENRCQPEAGDPCHPLAAGAHPPAITANEAKQTDRGVRIADAVLAFSCKDYGADVGTVSPTLRAGGYVNSHANAGVMPAVLFKSGAVRRLTPRECERLQGFPDDWTLVPFRGKPASDGPRYKAIGNSMAVPVMAWIGRRIQLVHDLLASLEKPSSEVA